MKIVITSKKPINDDVKGRLQKDTVIDLPDHKAKFYIERGEAVAYETKVMQDNPLKTGGATAQSSVARVVEALRDRMPNSLESGEKKTLVRLKRS